jgi:hypothetical protein
MVISSIKVNSVIGGICTIGNTTDAAYCMNSIKGRNVLKGVGTGLRSADRGPGNRKAEKLTPDRSFQDFSFSLVPPDP